MSHGLQFELAYTFSKSIDNASSFENILKPICDRCNRSLSLFDARHRFVINTIYQLPFSGNATPATYEVDGRQFVVIATSSGKSRAQAPATYVAFALDEP